MNDNYMKTILSGVKEWTENLTDDAVDKANNALDKANNALDKANNALDKALYVVNITRNSGGTLSADKTFEEISKVYNEGKYNIVAKFMGIYIMPLLAIVSDYTIMFGTTLNEEADIVSTIVAIAPDNSIQMIQTPLATTDSKLPNPYPLTFTGAVNETYDGSSAKTIEIPSGLPTGGAPYQQLVTDGTGKATWEDRTHWVEQSVVELIPEQTLSGGMSMGPAYMFNVSYFTIIPNLEYTVVFDGVEYKCISAELDGSTYIGNATLLGAPMEDTGEPFLIAPIRGMSVITATDGPHTIALSGWSIVYHQLLLDYIPNGKFLNGFIEHSSLTMTRDEASRYGRILSMSLFPMLVWQNFRIKSISIGTSNGVNVIYITEYDGALYTITENSDGLYSVEDANNGHNYLQIRKGNGSESSILLESGKPVSIEGTRQSTGNALDYTTFCVKKTGRQNGQDFEVLGNGTVKAYSVILPSSTAGSTKKFKITVDDSGTISATEVV